MDSNKSNKNNSNNNNNGSRRCGSRRHKEYIRVVLVPLLALLGSIIVVVGSGHTEPTQEWHDHQGLVDRFGVHTTTTTTTTTATAFPTPSSYDINFDRSINVNNIGVEELGDEMTAGTTFDAVQWFQEATSLSNTFCGTILLVVQVLAFASFFILQRSLLQWYKPIWLSALTFVMGAPQITLVTYASMKFWSGREEAVLAAAATALYAKEALQEQLSASSGANATTQKVFLQVASSLSPSSMVAAAANADLPQGLQELLHDEETGSSLLTGGHWEGKGTMPSLQRLIFAMERFPPGTELIVVLSLLYCVMTSVFYMSSQTWAGCYVDTSTVALVSWE